MSESQETVGACMWGFIESRGLTPAIAEAHADLREAVARSDRVARALDLGFPLSRVEDLSFAHVKSDPGGTFEVRSFLMSDVQVTGARDLFMEANALVREAKHMLPIWDHLRATRWANDTPSIQALRAAIEAYEVRWGLNDSSS